MRTWQITQIMLETFWQFHSKIFSGNILPAQATEVQNKKYAMKNIKHKILFYLIRRWDNRYFQAYKNISLRSTLNHHLIKVWLIKTKTETSIKITSAKVNVGGVTRFGGKPSLSQLSTWETYYDIPFTGVK